MQLEPGPKTRSTGRRLAVSLGLTASVATLGWWLAVTGVGRSTGRSRASVSAAPLAFAPDGRAGSQRPLSNGAGATLRPPADAPSDRDKGAALRAAVTAAVETLGGELNRAITADPRRQAYDECLRTHGDCESQRADLIFSSLTETGAAARVRDDAYGLRAWTAADDRATREAARAALGEVVASSADPLQRIAALLFVTYAEPYAPSHPRPLPDAAYRDLVGRPAPELRLIADLHRVAPPPSPEVARAFVPLAGARDVRVRRPAFDALGHAATAAELHAALLSAEPSAGDWPRIAQAIANCGLPCADSLEHVVEHEGHDARLAMYEALGLAPQAELAKLAELMVASSPPIDAEERATRTSLLNDALAESRPR